MNNVKIVKKDRSWVFFSMESIHEIDPETAILKQIDLGYHPAGYGFTGFVLKKDPVLMRYSATWMCSASCD